MIFFQEKLQFFKMLKLRNGLQLFEDEDLFEALSKVKEADCFLYSEDGTKIKIHKEILCQTSFMKNILLNANHFCCGNTEIYCPCSSDELELMVKFLYSGKISCEKKSDMPKILDNLARIFGFEENLFSNDENKQIINWTKDPLILHDSSDSFQNENILVESRSAKSERVKMEDFSNNEKAEIIASFLISKDEDSNLTIAAYAKQLGIKKSLLLKWIQEKNNKSSATLKNEGREMNVTTKIEKSLKQEKNMLDLTLDEKNDDVKMENTEMDESLSHDLKENYNCYICEAGFFQRKFLETHFAEDHNGQNPYKCKLCERSYLRSEYLRRHVASIHKGKKSPSDDGQNCSFCKKDFSTNQHLRRHITSVHFGKKPYTCSFCGSKFMEKRIVQDHIESVHEGKKPNLCSTCNHNFTRREHLKRHIASVHEGKKPYMCSSCDKSFVFNSLLKKHIVSRHVDTKN